MGLDIRVPLGLIFLITGGIIFLYGLFTRGSAIYERSLGIDVNLYWGLIPFRLDFHDNPEFNIERTFKYVHHPSLLVLNSSACLSLVHCPQSKTDAKSSNCQEGGADWTFWVAPAAAC